MILKIIVEIPFFFTYRLLDYIYANNLIQNINLMDIYLDQ